jgi:hypothetical protein
LVEKRSLQVPGGPVQLVCTSLSQLYFNARKTFILSSKAMADPLTIISAAASVASIVELLGKTVSAFHTLHNRWKEAEFIFINLIA